MSLKAKVLETARGNVQIDVVVRYFDSESEWSQDVVIVVPEEQFGNSENFINRRISEEGQRYKDMLDIYKLNEKLKDKVFDI